MPSLPKGIIAILNTRVFSNQHPKAIIEADTDFIDQIGSERASVAHPCQRFGQHDKAIKNVCYCIPNTIELK
jgi:hypothetical protein